MDTLRTYSAYYLPTWLGGHQRATPPLRTDLDRAAAFCAKPLPPTRSECTLFVDRGTPIARIARTRPQLGPSAGAYRFVSFAYDSGCGARAVCTRAELRRAYTALRSDLERTRRRVAGMQRAFLVPFVGTPGAAARFEAAFSPRVRALEARAAVLIQRQEWALRRFAAALAHLLRLEESGTQPPRWAAYLGLDAEMVRLPHSRESAWESAWEKAWSRGGSEDWAFRAARLVNASPTPRELRALYRDLWSVEKEMRHWKGYPAETEVRSEKTWLSAPPDSAPLANAPLADAPPVYDPPPPYTP